MSSECCSLRRCDVYLSVQITSSAVQGCDSPLHWIYTGVSQGKLIQNGFVTKQHSFVPNKRFPLPAWGQKKSFCSSPEIGSQALHYAGRTWEPSLFIMNPTVCTAAARTSLVRGGAPCRMEQEEALPNICFVWDHMHQFYSKPEKTAKAAVEP